MAVRSQINSMDLQGRLCIMYLIILDGANTQLIPNHDHRPRSDGQLVTVLHLVLCPSELVHVPGVGMSSALEQLNLCDFYQDPNVRSLAVGEASLNSLANCCSAAVCRRRMAVHMPGLSAHVCTWNSAIPTASCVRMRTRRLKQIA